MHQPWLWACVGRCARCHQPLPWDLQHQPWWCRFAFRNTNSDLCVFVRGFNEAYGTLSTTRDPDNGVDRVSKRGFQPFLQGLAKTIRKNKNKKHIELTGYESAQRKRFLRSEAEDVS